MSFNASLTHSPKSLIQTLPSQPHTNNSSHTDITNLSTDADASTRVGSSASSAKSKEVEAKPSEPPKKPYSIFTKAEKWCIVGMAATAGLFSPFTANIYFPAIPTIAAAFHQSTENINLTVTVYMIMQGLSPSVFGSIADRKGRRPIFLLCILILSLSNIGLALVPTNAYWLLVLLRILQATGSASTIALGAGAVVDISTPEERGGFVGFSTVGPLLGPCIGPVIGGVLADRFGWRAIFWFLAIAVGLCFIFMLALYPETLRAMVGNGSIPAPRWNRPLIPIIGRSAQDFSSERPPAKALPNPFKLFTHPDILILLSINGIIYSVLYAVTTTIASLFQENYPNLTETEIGLCFLSVGGGTAIATVTTGKMLDWQFGAMKRKVREIRGGDVEKKEGNTVVVDDQFPLEFTRLQSQHVCIPAFVLSCIGYGWCIQAKTHIAGPLVLQFIIGYVMSATMTVTQTLTVDLFPTQGSSVTAANNLVRCCSGAVLVSVIDLIIKALGTGWTYTVLGAVCIVCWPLLVWEIRMGPKWRAARSEQRT